MTSLTRGPLPASVYWRRRLVLLGLALALVLAVTRLFGGGGDGDPSGADAAAQVSGETSEAPSGDPSEDTKPRQRKPKKPKRTTEPQEPVLAQPEGPCQDSDILITPTVDRAVAGRPVTVTLELRTATSPACTWRVAPQHVAVKITSGSDRIWTSGECPKAIPTQDVVVRRDVTTFVDVAWKARRSAAGCPVQTQWALPGTYHVHAAALGGEPSEARFELERPTAQVIPPPANNTQPKQKPGQQKPGQQKPSQNKPGQNKPGGGGQGTPDQHEDQPSTR